MNLDLSRPASEIMTSPVRCIEADWTLQEAVRFFLEHAVSGAPVVEDQRPVGVLTLRDVARFTELHLEAESETQAGHDPELEPETPELQGTMFDGLDHATVRQVMTPRVTSVSASTPIADVLNLLLRLQIHRVFVTDDAGIVGVVSMLDLLRWFFDRCLPRVAESEPSPHPQGPGEARRG